MNSTSLKLFQKLGQGHIYHPVASSLLQYYSSGNPAAEILLVMLPLLCKCSIILQMFSSRDSAGLKTDHSTDYGGVALLENQGLLWKICCLKGSIYCSISYMYALCINNPTASGIMLWLEQKFSRWTLKKTFKVTAKVHVVQKKKIQKSVTRILMLMSRKHVLGTQ